ncbi:large subunit ribosomal protein L28 [Flexibacter flexilis DSM 6793]|uniref:Large ribosomal subunit protein bL28 n=2 Tax=Flexibacter flexilis TaxID=998 RepID=A0A1I1MZW8_9BACT|nr:large subunit ribosomal protein L28 [Flexibacter flexilis DSM 6793]
MHSVSQNQFTKMAKVCQITGKRTIVGNHVSHANNKTKRKFFPNLHVKKFYLPEEDAWITLKVSSAAIRTINKNGIYSVLKKAVEQGHLLF